MVHSQFGAARITYPTGVTISPADPMTHANLPHDLLAVPGAVSRPIRLSALGEVPANLSGRANQLIQHYLGEARGDPLQAAAAAKAAREKDPNNIDLRNAEHALFSYYMIDKLGPILGAAVVGVSVPLYSLVKSLAKMMGLLKKATPPSWQEMQYGLRPLVSPKPGPAARAVSVYVTVGAWPGMQGTLGECQKYLVTHGGRGCQGYYSDGTPGPFVPASPGGKLSGLEYYPNLGQELHWGEVHEADQIEQEGQWGEAGQAGQWGYQNLGQYGASAGVASAGSRGIPTWLWYVGGYAALYLLFSVFSGGRRRY